MSAAEGRDFVSVEVEDARFDNRGTAINAYYIRLIHDCLRYWWTLVLSCAVSEGATTSARQDLLSYRELAPNRRLDGGNNRSVLHSRLGISLHWSLNRPDASIAGNDLACDVVCLIRSQEPDQLCDLRRLAESP